MNSMALEFNTSISLLLHAVVVAWSPEVQTVDFLIHTTTTGARLPPEILLVIRDHLVPALIADTLENTRRALGQYESFRKQILCPDCLSYNLEVFGTDIWSWDSFAGPCHCNLKRLPLSSAILPDYLVYMPLRGFPDRLSWLEAYLSHKLQSSFQGKLTSTKIIWFALDERLQQLQCQLVSEALLAWLNRPSSIELVSIHRPIPTIVSIKVVGLLLTGPERVNANSLTTAQNTVRQAVVNLGLDFGDYKDVELQPAFEGPKYVRLDARANAPASTAGKDFTLCLILRIALRAAAAAIRLYTPSQVLLNWVCYYLS
jgi:hypothetical protein